MKFPFWNKKSEDPVEVEDEFEYQPPSIERVKLRLMVLAANGARVFAENMFLESPEEWTENIAELRAYVNTELVSELTADEKARHDAPAGAWSESDLLQDSWDREATAPLLWALGIQERTHWQHDRPIWDEIFDWPEMKTWRPEAKLLSLDKIDDEQRMYEAIYWRIRAREGESKSHIDYVRKLMGRSAKLKHITIASDGDLANLEGVSVSSWNESFMNHTTSLVMERMQALNWLIGQESDWDKITLDTVVNWLWDEHWLQYE
jgi:hypothetical protein